MAVEQFEALSKEATVNFAMECLQIKLCVVKLLQDVCIQAVPKLSYKASPVCLKIMLNVLIVICFLKELAYLKYASLNSALIYYFPNNFYDE